jgi:homoserine/homoserine lactone efflux protein
VTADRWMAFLVTWAAVSAFPGPNAAFAIGAGLSNRLPRAFLGPVGVGLAACAQVALVSAGLAAVLVAVPQLFTAIKWAGVAYLAWLGFRQLATPGHSPGARGAHGGDRPVSRAGLVLRGFLNSASNPKAILAYAVILPQFLVPRHAVGPQLAILAVTASSVVTLTYCGYAAAARGLSTRLARPNARGAVARTAGAAYLAAAVFLAVLRR